MAGQIDKNWHAKITDFGISRQLVPTTMTHRVGTTRWTAPEVLSYGEHHYSTKADVYSYGILLYVRPPLVCVVCVVCVVC